MDGTTGGSDSKTSALVATAALLILLFYCCLEEKYDSGRAFIYPWGGRCRHGGFVRVLSFAWAGLSGEKGDTVSKITRKSIMQDRTQRKLISEQLLVLRERS
jgi:hypothetical protein